MLGKQGRDLNPSGPFKLAWPSGSHGTCGGRAMGTCEWKDHGGLMFLEFSTGVMSEKVGVAPHPV